MAGWIGDHMYHARSYQEKRAGVKKCTKVMHKKRQNVIIYTIGICEIAIHGSNEKMKWLSDCDAVW